MSGTPAFIRVPAIGFLSFSGTKIPGAFLEGLARPEKKTGNTAAP